MYLMTWNEIIHMVEHAKKRLGVETERNNKMQ